VETEAQRGAISCPGHTARFQLCNLTLASAFFDKLYFEE
jgi:hypothetical protein